MQTDLLSKLQKAGEGSRELDVAVFCATNDGWSVGRGYLSGAVACGPHGERHGANDLGRYTTSIDAAVALIERKLPGWSWGVSGALGPKCDGLLYEPGPGGFQRKVKSSAAKPAVALCIALLNAIEARHG